MESISAALEVSSRPSRIFMAIVQVDEPHSFYQVISFRSPRIATRTNKYLVNAREARSIDTKTSIFGRLYLIGYVDKSLFEGLKTLLRIKIGPETNISFQQKLLNLSPTECLSFQFAHNSEAGFTERVFDEDKAVSIRETVAKLVALNPRDWLI